MPTLVSTCAHVPPPHTHTMKNIQAVLCLPYIHAHKTQSGLAQEKNKKQQKKTTYQSWNKEIIPGITSIRKEVYVYKTQMLMTTVIIALPRRHKH